MSFEQADIFDLPYGPASFDHVFVCFVLEHLANPVAALTALRRLVVPGGSITVIEGDHGSHAVLPRVERSNGRYQLSGCPAVPSGRKLQHRDDTAVSVTRHRGLMR